MTTMRFDDETLMAFADGETDDETTAAIEAAIGTDPVLAERVGSLVEERLAAVRPVAREAMTPLRDIPVPEALEASVRAMIEAHGEGRGVGSTVLPFNQPARTPPRAANQNNGARWAIPIAASLTLIAGAVGYLAATVGETGPGAGAPQIALFQAPGLERALSTVASGGQSLLDGGVGEFRAIASFRDGSERLCREFELEDPSAAAFVGVACADGESWRVTFAMTTAVDEGGYAPASSLDVLDSYLSGIEAEAPMSAEEENAALSQID